MKLLQFVSPSFASLTVGALALGMAGWLGDTEDGATESDDGDFNLDDEFDMDDGGFDDEFGSFDDGEGSGDSSVTELENRIEDLEHEISDVASKANTVRSENEQISDSVEDVEENVRKLLEIYEMVTRGVNPFVDDVGTNAMGGGGDGGNSFGLFDEEEAEEEEPEDLDEDIANADATEFFDDGALDDFEDFDGDDPDDLGDFGLENESENDEAADEETTESGDVAAEAESDEESSDAGTSFEELKAEYDAGEADWADDVDLDDEQPPGTSTDDMDEDELFVDDDLAGDEEADTAAAGAESDPEAGNAGENVSDEDETDFQFGASRLDDTAGEPHLAEPPTGYLADVLMIEWLSYLLSEFGPRNTVRALNYYERIGWISEPVRGVLFEFLEGLADLDHLYREEFGTTELTMDDHLRCLEYIDELASDDVGRAVIERREDAQTNGI